MAEIPCLDEGKSLLWMIMTVIQLKFMIDLLP